MASDALTPLAAYSKNIYSQCGEDGIIEEILTRIGRVLPSDNWCVEFGAWDGVQWSNTCNLIRNKAYRAVLIEGSSKKYRQLCENFSSADIIKICQFVNFSGDTALEAILKKTPIPQDFDFLSIDIDGCDYFILESLICYRPKLICVEFNFSTPNEVDFVQPKDFSVRQGSSAAALVRLAEQMGYALVAVTFGNLLFVRNELKNAVLGSQDVSLETLWDDKDWRTFIYFGYDGTLLTNKPSILMPWHGIKLNSSNLQQIPKYLRSAVPNYTVAQRVLFYLFLALEYPKGFASRFTKMFANRVG